MTSGSKASGSRAGGAPPAGRTPGSARVDDWLQYTHLEKLYGYLPGMADALPGIFGLTRQEYHARRAAYTDTARDVAAELLLGPGVGELVDAAAAAAGRHLLVVGDSITDDLQSWAEVLQHLLQLRRPDNPITVANAGLSAHTTAMILRRWPATLAAASPDLIICALGGNDVTRVGASAQKTVVSRSETIANLRELRRLAAERDVRRWVWISPAPVIEERVRQHRPFRFGQSDWRNADIVALTAAVLEFPEPTVDLTTLFGVPADPNLQGPDGVHPTLAGQRAITTAVLETVSTSHRPPYRPLDDGGRW